MRYKILISIALLNLLPTAYAMNKPAADTADPYQYCFATSTWVVPPQTLLSYLYNNGTAAPASDQTVWVFSNYNHGYFTGQSYTSINNSILSQKFLIGSVTPEGKVYITFYSGTSTSTDLVT